MHLWLHFTILQSILSKLKDYQYFDQLETIFLEDIQYYHRIPVIASLLHHGISFQANTPAGNSIINYYELEKKCLHRLENPNLLYDADITLETRFQKEYKTLDLRNMELYEFPEVIYAFSEIEVLRLNGNQLTKLPESAQVP